MCDSALPTGLTQNSPLVLSPGIIGLFIQGIESGLVLTYFCRWLSTRGHGRYFESTTVIFVTIVGLAQSGIYFASIWTRYVQQFGITPTGQNWGVLSHPIPTLLISVPVQVFMIRRCYMLVGKNKYIITLLVLLLVASIVMSLWSIFLLVDYLIIISAPEYLPSPSQWVTKFGLWPYLMTVVLSSVLDFILTGIILYRLIRTKKYVYTAHIRKQITHFMNIVWQSALPPTLTAICFSVLYIQYYVTKCESKSQFWLTVVQAMIGKLYVLSLFFLITALQPLPMQNPDEQSKECLTTLPMLTEDMSTFTQDARVGGDACGGRIVAGYVHEKVVGFAV